jgi:Rha family phage regulatory protein
MKGGKLIADSRDVAATFGKRHGDVIRAVRELIESAEELDQRNFASINFVDAGGRTYPAYEMDRDGFSLLAMGFNGEKALRWKLRYIKG